MAKKQAKYLGFDLSTTALACGVTDDRGNEEFVSIPMQGATRWRDQPAFDAEYIPAMIKIALEELQRQDWDFSLPGNLCFSVRQHDMVLVGENSQPIMPILSWQCDAAEQEVEELRNTGAEDSVGRIEARFILPKLLWTLRTDTTLRSRIWKVMTTGDFVGWKLTGSQRISTSDGVSNGLLMQTTKNLATGVLGRASFLTDWFPTPRQSGTDLGLVEVSKTNDHPDWDVVRLILENWNVRAGLGDNHASAVGCGLSDFETIVLSFGSSGTTVRRCLQKAELAGNAACFEFFEHRLLLNMMAHCAVWYNWFRKKFAGCVPLNELDAMAFKADMRRLCFLDHPTDGQESNVSLPPEWDNLSLEERTASIQVSIAIHMLRLARAMMTEVKESEPPKRFVITGGMSRSPLLCQTILLGLGPDCKVLASERTGPLANKAAVLGAMFTAMANTTGYPNLQYVIKKHCPLAAVPLDLPEAKKITLVRFVKSNLE